jgi:hypothetical protein
MNTSPLTQITGNVRAALVFWFCARHDSGEGRDAAIMSRLVWTVPFFVTPIAFPTILAPDATNWWWLARAIVFTYIAIFVCGYQFINGLGLGSKGQEVAFILLVMLGAVAIGIATAITGTMTLAATKPGFANWFHAHTILGSFLVALSAIPIAFALGTITAFLGAILLAFYCEVFKR